ncbi:nitroreductase family protein [Actinokineospora enzanensis]|uniref:nitroreductase family protein n=1 Tax=Actinokineospora enzanensis TaxID=155975 RepID=UPI0003628B2D|nr:nitroreductase family protein [Actinokineospora enzanensis]
MSGLPRLARGLVVIPTEHGLIVDGTPQRSLLPGGIVSEVIESLLPLLDGTRDTTSLCAAADLRPSQLDRILTLLDDHGVIEHVPPDAPPPRWMAEHAATYFSRNRAATGGHRCVEELAEVLGRAHVLLVAPPCLAEPITADLLATGVGSVVVRSSPVSVTDRLTPADVAAVHDGTGFDAFVSRTDPGTRVLRFALTGGRAELGPVFTDEYTTCVRCFRQGYSALPPNTDDPGPAGEILAAMVVKEVLALLAWAFPPQDGRRLTLFSQPGLPPERYDVAPEPGCPRCLSAGTPAEIYEWQMERAPVGQTWPGTPSALEHRQLAALQLRREVLPFGPRLRLAGMDGAPEPRARLDAGEWTADDEPVPLDALVVAAILARVAGLRQEPVDRWAPSAGNLASVELFVLTDPGFFTLPGTVFKYDDLQHELVTVHAGTTPLAEHLRSTDLDPAVALVFVGNIGRLRVKYGDFAYRLTHLDAGCATTQLAAVCAGYGVEVAFASRWSSELGVAIELDVNDEIVTTVAGIGGRHAVGTRF